ncbi:pathogenesis-related protein PR-1-like [Cornus florida]|uniref:pathogenesis-related protein PR-1-like n=1 Tax=Cornus florida TaxID=4283 RepID=UPI00289EAD0B|nr:pathogenesis-related protein PR-1-like [Cornus florida]
MKSHLVVFILIITVSSCNNHMAYSDETSPTQAPKTKTNQLEMPNNNETIYKISKQLCWGCSINGESLQFLFAHNLVRAAKWELPLIWDFELERYASWWAAERKADCKLMHSFPEDDFKLGENIYWGSGSTWTPTDAVNAWSAEEKYYSYATNTCVFGQQCGHYTQIVWRNTRRLGCARVVCDTGDVFMTCNYDPVGNYDGERPY